MYNGILQGTHTYFTWVYPDRYQLSDAWVTERTTACRNGLIQKIKSDTHAGNFLAESHKAIDGVIRSARAVLGSFALLNHGDVTGAARTLLRGLQGVDGKHGFTSRAARLRNETLKGKKFQKSTTDSLNREDVASMWLAWKYGWEPLIHDVYGFMSEIEKFRKESPMIYRKKASYVESIPKIQVNQGSNIVSVQVPTTKSVIVRMKWELAENPSYAWKLGLLDPAVVAWEVIPFSFVVDWFVPVQNSLEAWSAAPFLSLKSWTWSHVKQNTAYETNFGFKNLTGGQVFYGNNISYRESWYNRYTGNDVYSALAGEPEHPIAATKAVEKTFSTTHLSIAAALLSGFIHEARGPFAAQRKPSGSIRSFR